MMNLEFSTSTSVSHHPPQYRHTCWAIPGTIGIGSIFRRPSHSAASATIRSAAMCNPNETLSGCTQSSCSSHSTNPQTSGDNDKVCIIGSGNWGSAIATIVGRNCERLHFCEKDVNMWVYEEQVEVDGQLLPLTEVINSYHENVKYLPVSLCFVLSVHVICLSFDFDNG